MIPSRISRTLPVIFKNFLSGLEFTGVNLGKTQLFQIQCQTICKSLRTRGMKMLNKVLKVQECDAREDTLKYCSWYHNLLLLITFIQ